MRAAAIQAGVNLNLLDHRPGTPAQFNILLGTTAEDLELLLEGASSAAAASSAAISTRRDLEFYRIVGAGDGNRYTVFKSF